MSRAGSFVCALTSAVKTTPRTGSGVASKRPPTNANQPLERHQNQRQKKHTIVRPDSGREYGLSRVERAFIDALSRAGTCRSCAHRPLRPYGMPTSIFSKNSSTQPTSRDSNRLTRPFSTQTPEQTKAAVATATRSYKVTRDELMQLVDNYSFALEDHPKKQPPSPSLRNRKARLKLVAPFVPARSVSARQIEELTRLLKNSESPHAQVFEAYRKLPPPRANYLDGHLLGKLLHHLAVVERKAETSMLRYLSVVEDAKSAGVPIHTAHWNSALSFTGRWVARVTVAEVESTLYRWREMEEEVGVRSSQVTFNILFDIATRAGKFALAEAILKEMKARGFEYNRYLRVGLIYHCGLRGDGDGVRRSYRELVEAGNIVDTCVITCVIASLIKCNEAFAAEHVFARMKELHAAKSESPLPPSTWRENRELGRVLERASRRYRHDKESLARVQSKVTFAPNVSTYLPLLYYHAVTVGDIDRVMELLQEMEFFRLPLPGGVLLDLFKAFGFHGGELYTSWTSRRLESLWNIFIERLGSGGSRGSHKTYWSTSVAMLAVKAYAKCTSYERTIQIWKEIQSRWGTGCTSEDRSSIEQLLGWLYPDRYIPEPESELEQEWDEKGTKAIANERQEGIVDVDLDLDLDLDLETTPLSLPTEEEIAGIDKVEEEEEAWSDQFSARLP